MSKSKHYQFNDVGDPYETSGPNDPKAQELWEREHAIEAANAAGDRAVLYANIQRMAEANGFTGATARELLEWLTARCVAQRVYASHAVDVLSGLNATQAAVLKMLSGVDHG